MVDELIAQKLDTLIRLQAHLAVGNLPSQKEKILFLGRVGLGPKDIADILGTTPNTVNVALSTARKEGTLKKRTAQKDESNGQS
ncbi:MAG: sigma factor-like helix-turn-helix DNA-binding protein [Rhizobiaceae bacterium]